MKKSNERGDTDSFKTQKQSFKIAPKRRIKRKLKIRTLEKKQTYSKHIFRQLSPEVIGWKTGHWRAQLIRTRVVYNHS